jgi:hypothetical protein
MAGSTLPQRVATARRRLAARLERVLGRGYHAREAFFNALYMQVGCSQTSSGGALHRFAAEDGLGQAVLASWLVLAFFAALPGLAEPLPAGSAHPRPSHLVPVAALLEQVAAAAAG